MDRLVPVGNWLGDGEHPRLHAGPKAGIKRRQTELGKDTTKRRREKKKGQRRCVQEGKRLAGKNPSLSAGRANKNRMEAPTLQGDDVRVCGLRER